jgi:hypothetical protein
MKRIFVLITLLAVALSLVSCNKHEPAPKELAINDLTMAKIAIHTKGDVNEDTVTSFRDAAVYKKSEKAGKSRFFAYTGGRMVYDAFTLSLYFNSVDNLKVGDALNLNDVLFSFILSSNSNASTHDCEGKITLAEKGSDYVILRFEALRFNCSLGEYVTDGYLRCPLFEEYRY